MNVFIGILLIGLVTAISCKPPPWEPPPFQGQLGTERVKRSSQCYSDLGCFSNEYPFNNSDNALPLNPQFIRTSFLLFTTTNDRIPKYLRRDSPQLLQRSRYDGSKPTKFIIHGFEQRGMVPWTRKLAKQLILKEPTNVIIVDWGHGSGWPYTQAVANTRVVGAEVAKIIEFLISRTNGDISRFHLIGHSLGAHVCGYAGEALNGRLGRITGLDPAEPNFKDTNTRVRLDPNDAVFVDVIHTDGSAFDDISGYGLIDPVGDIDFYPNGGENQPGCTKESWSNLLRQSYNSGIMRTADMMSCSHTRSIFLFTESINSACKFRAFPCDSFSSFKEGKCMSCGNTPCPTMGLGANNHQTLAVKPRGKYYLVTGKTDHYCGYTYAIELHLSNGMQPSEGLIDVSFIGQDGQQADHSFYSDEYTSGQVYHGLIWSPAQLSAISAVNVGFKENSKLWSWIWAGSVQINMIVLTDSRTDERELFCGNDVVVNSGSNALLSKTSSDCTGHVSIGMP